MDSFIGKFSATALKCSGKTALVDLDGTRRTTYAELDALRLKVAAKIIASGVTPGSAVLINMGRQREYVAGILGVLSAGCAFVPLTPEYPQARIGFIKNDCGATLTIDEDFFADINGYKPAALVKVEADAPAYLVYTSGSTGTPKGVLHTVASLTGLIDRTCCLFDIDGPLVHGAGSTFSFAITLFDVLTPLQCGAEVHIISEPVRKDVTQLAKYYKEHDISIGIISPQLLRNFKSKSGSLKRVITAGEMLSGVWSPDYEIVNAYGTSEMGLACSFKVDKAYANTPIGTPFEGCGFVLLDADGNQAYGEGELCVTGPCAKEYLNDPEKSAKTFEKRPDGSVLYHTGDLVKRTEEGVYVYLNRLDWMVKVNGQRVEILEIESILKQLPCTANAAVKAFVDSDGQNYLCAYYTMQSGSDTTDVEIRRCLSEKVPPYMIPRFFCHMAELPLNDHGKLDRKALLPPGADDCKAAYRAPENERQTAVCEAFSEVLRCGKVGLDDDFFALGGDSIKVLRLAEAIRTATGMSLDASALFVARTVEGVASLLKTEEVRTRTSFEPVPLTESQRGVYFECMEAPESTMYNIPFALELPAAIDLEKFIGVVEKVAALHPALRATFNIRKGEPVMEITGPQIYVAKTESNSIAAAKAAFVRPFDLENGPLSRFELCGTPEGSVFLLDVHHLVFDGTSFSVFMSQVADAYAGKPVSQELKTLMDVAEEEPAMSHDSKEYRRAQEFFRQMLEGMECDSRIIPDKDSGSQRGATTISVKAPEGLLTDMVENFTRKNRITENTLFLGAFSYTLAQFAGAHDSCFTTASNGRHSPLLGNTVGMFVKTLPLHIGFKDGQSVQEYLAGVQDMVFNAIANDCISFGELAHDYGVNASVSFVYQSELLSEVTFDGCAVLPEQLPANDCQSDIICMVRKTAAGYRLDMTWRSDLYTPQLMESFSEAVFNAAASMLASASMDDLELVSESQRAFIDAFNRTEADAPAPSTVNEVIDSVITKYAERTVVVYEDDAYTFRQFDSITRSIAAYINSKGIGTDDFVAVLVPRNQYMVLGAWGVIRAGAAFQPLDPTYPKERLNYMVSDSHASLLIADRSLVGLLDEYDGTVLYTDEIAGLPEAPDFAVQPHPEDALTMIYTSGTTGKPKGCVLENRNLAAFWRNHSGIMGYKPESRVASYASFGFDAGVMDAVTVPMCGAALYIIPDRIRLDLPAMEQFFCKNRLTHAFMTTQLGRMFAQQTRCTSLEAFLVGGEKLVPFTPPESLRFINGYGPCETMGYICSHVVKDNSTVQPIGKPSPDIKLYVIDTHGHLLPPGASGELCISGCQMGRGYLGLPEKTAQVFVPNPFDGNRKGYARMYRTGDVVRLLPAGEIEFIGRSDGQVKIRGFRVELTEVEEVIRRFDGITDATVSAFDDPAGGKFLAAYVVGPAKIDTDALAAFIRREKPAYMVPAVTMQLDAIPYTQNQKVNRRALPKPQRGSGEKEIVKPETDAQQKMYSIAAEILGHEDFGITTNLFEAGMTSIGLLKFNAALAEAFGRAVKISELSELGTIKAIDAFFGHSEQVKTWAIQEDYPLMQNQMGVFVESGMKEGNLDYNIPLLMRISPELEPEKLRAAMCAAISAHPYMKATLKTDEAGNVRAVRNDAAEPVVEIIRSNTLPPAESLVRPFNLIGEPLYRAFIYLTTDGNYMVLDVHHIISDGVSVAILLSDIDKSLDGQSLKTESFTGFEAALEEEEIRAGEKYSAANAYFDTLLEGCNTECMPGKCPEDEAPEGSNTEASVSLEGCSEAVLEYCKKENFTLNAFFNAVFSYTLAQFIHSEDVTYCTVYNGRNDSRLASSFAMLVKTLPVCANIKTDAAVKDFVRGIQEQIVGTMASDAVSFAEISKKFGVKPDIFFNYQGDGFIFDSLGGKPAEVLTVETGASKAPLSFELFLDGGKFRMTASWRRDMLCREFIESFASAFETAAKGFTCTQKLGQVQLLSAGEKAYFNRMNATDTDFIAAPAWSFISRWAEECPDCTAVRTASASLTFKQLDEMSDRVANSLVAMGATGNEIIGLIMERSELVPVAEIGIMKAGCAFLPMLPSYPAERIEFCMNDAMCRFKITDENIHELIDNGSAGHPEAVYHGSDLAYCIYTSGSTGKPKGVMIEQHNLTNFVQTAGVNEAYSRGSSILCMASVSFDMSMTEIFASLCHGKTAYIASEEEVHNLDMLLQAFKTAGTDIIMMTPSFAWSLLSLPEFEAALGQLNAVVLGAEAFQPALLSKLKALNPDMLVQNGYGPTECTQVCSIKTLEPGCNITIGGPFANTRFHVMNECGVMLPRYAVGELIISGEGVCRGYVGLEEKNRATFFSVDGVRAYRSGDLVRVNRDLEVEFGGRKDNQVKLRGFRIELDEVEAVMQEFEGVTRSKVILRGNGSDAFLAGFFTADRPIETDALTAFMKTRLTYYMVPSALMQLEKMPMTQGGKLDAKALPEIRPAVRKRTERRTPKKSLEERILEEFKAATGVEDIFIDDNFFEVGGTSLSASKVVMKLKSTGLKIEYQDIFDHQTAEELAQYLEPAEAAPVQEKPQTESQSEDASVHESAEDRETLKYNTLDHAAEVERKPLGNVLLTGSTGFLGCHVLKELLDSEEGHIYCLLRKGHYKDLAERLQGMLFYYFDNAFKDSFGTRISVVEGDITDASLPEILKDVQFDTLINCAACVKHYAGDNSIEFVNVHGVANLISLCKSRGARMIQISTTSVPGAHTPETYRHRLTMTEDRLFYVDDMNNQYCQSKFKAEQLMLAAIRDGMSGKIIRVGNLMGRHSDGEFQVNTHTNAFLNGLRGFTAIGKCPISHATDRMGLSPIDCTARAVVLLAGTNDCFTAFNADNRWWLDEMNIMETVNRCGIKVTPVPDEEYYADFYAMMGDARKNEKVSALLTNDRPDIHVVETDNRFTANILYRLGFSWPLIDNDYLEKVIRALDTLGFFII